ncbi:hypothetical protein BBJ28_00019850 [Nothophytophthora sp. Chile5]|nr:hypothetical protein BBJ28_00019850 [Nothophytophthora sp. Chile5]
MGMFTPSPTINYDFVSGVYAFFSSVCLLLSVLHFYSPQVEGFYIVLVPFVPSLVWALVVRRRWLKERTAESSKGDAAADDDDNEAKKEK